jgi:hypothetical protein
MSTDTTTDLPETTKKHAAVPAAIARLSVLIGLGGTMPIIRPPPPLTRLPVALRISMSPTRYRQSP